MARARLLLPLVLVLAPGCFFAPPLDENGYVRCAADEDCEPGRGCFSGRCSPPPWNDAAFASRQLLVVENVAEEVLPAGAAVPVRIGAGGLLDSAALGVDGRLTYYSFAAGAWTTVPTWRDVYDDHLLLYVPVQADVPAAEDGPLAWVETTTGTDEPAPAADPTAVFPLFFDELEGDALAADRWATYGTGGSPIVSGGRVNVADNQKLVSTLPLTPPFSLTFKGRVNGVTCDALYVGLVSDDGAGFEPPSAGFFVEQDLATILEVGPAPDSVPQMPPDLDGLVLDTALHRFRLDVGSTKVRFAIDGEVVGEPATLRFLGEQLYFTVDVDGACSFDLETVHVSPLPFARPGLRTGAVVGYEIFE